MIELFWIPLGAGGHSVRFNGIVYEALVSARGRRPRHDLYHAALVVDAGAGPCAIEVAPSPDAAASSRGVVATGPVGSRRLGRFRLFRYEVRCWHGGSIPDLAEAVDSPRRLSSDCVAAGRLLEAAVSVPTYVWGRDELGAGDMWNSNSVVAWLLTVSGLPADEVRPPPHGRAPGWDAGLVAAERGSGYARTGTASLAMASISAAARSNSSSERTGVPSNGSWRWMSTHEVQPPYSSRTFTVTGRGMR